QLCAQCRLERLPFSARPVVQGFFEGRSLVAELLAQRFQRRLVVSLRLVAYEPFTFLELDPGFLAQRLGEARKIDASLFAEFVFPSLVSGGNLPTSRQHRFLLAALRLLSGSGVLLYLIAQRLFACVEVDARLTERFLIANGLLVRFR
ncbi:MAG: hypothetical protein ACREI7_00755, partial [Myxococcota bacterium]